jgi:hypothetical protein
MHARQLPATIILLATVACFPPKIGSGPTDESDSGEVGSDSTSTTTSMSPTDSETSDTETSTDSTTADFIPRVDSVTVDECDSLAQDCPEGEKCVPYSTDGGPWNANKCVPVTGDGQPGEPCSWGGIIEATDDCDETSMCWDVMDIDGQLVGVCTPFCTGTEDNPECPPGASCLIGSDSTIALCIFSCDPLLQDCGRGLACFWVNNSFSCIFTMQDIPTGEPCGYVNDCAAGNGCVPAEALPSCAGEACCTLFCNIEQGDQQCEALPGTSCVPFFEEGQAPPGYELLGLCALPGVDP